MTQQIRPACCGLDFCGLVSSFPRAERSTSLGREMTYQQLAYLAKRLAATLRTGAVPGPGPLTAAFAYRSETAYAAALGVLMAGHGYVPVNRTFRGDRTRLMRSVSSSHTTSCWRRRLNWIPV